MAAAVVGGSLLSAALQVIFDRLASSQVLDFLRGRKLDDKLLTRLHSTLHAANAVLDDAEHKQVKYPVVKNWLDDLKDAVYLTEDLMDQVATKAACHKKEVRNNNFFSNFLQDREMVKKIENIVNLLESIMKCQVVLCLKEGVGENLNFSWKTPSTSLVESSAVFGRDKDKEAIIGFLLSDTVKKNRLSVIPIVGMGGIGKTTLAQLVYNDDRVKQNYELTAWVCVSEEFNVAKIMKAILETITSQRSNMEELDILLLELRKRLSGKKFLFILDDIWNENYVDWDHLRSSFLYGAQGSAIIVTTRSEKVASFMQTTSSHRLGHLSDNDSWNLLAKHAFDDKNSNLDPVLEKIGNDIVKKCQGLPLAVKTLGGLLRSKPDVKDWDIILRNDIWNLPENESQIIPALRISYYYLPPCLKRNKKDCFVMHHLIHDLAKFVAGEFCLASEADNVQRIPSRTRHLSYDALNYPVFKDFTMFCEAKHLRTFLPIYSDNYGVLPLHERVPHLIFAKLRCLRVLSLSGYGTVELLPDSIGELIHLRYLDLSRTKIKLLPDSVCGLYNLQTLKLADCFYLTKLPEDFFRLANLRYLDIRRAGLEEMPRRIGELKNLQFLSDFIIGKETRIAELGELQDLGKSLIITRLENTENVLGAKMKDKKYLEHLEFSWSSQYCSSIPLEGFETKILHNLQPQMNLKSLSIRGYSGSEFPVWIGHNSYHNMVSLSLHCCDCSWLPPLGQLPSLKHLLIHRFHKTQSIGSEFFGTNEFSSTAPFASLKTLVFSELENLLSLQAEPLAFQQLCELELRKCSSLVGHLPNNLPSLEKLVIIGCNNLFSSLPTSPIVQEIEIHQSENVVLKELPVSLHSLRVSGSNLVDSIFMSMMQRGSYLENLNISDCSSSISISGGCLPNSLKTLEFKNCKNFEVHMHQCHMALESYKIQNSCDLVESFLVDMFPVLKSLHIESCENLASLVADEPLEHLDSIAIIQCHKLVSFHEFGLYAPRLRSLTISRCENLKSLPDQMQSLLPTLTELSICDCPGIESFPEMGLPSSLKSLVISNCLKLTALRVEWNLPRLTSLTISGIYDIVESFPEEGFLPDTLTYLSIEKVLMLKLDCKQLQCITSLKYLWIVNCPMLESMTEASLPYSLIKLTIRNCTFLEEKCCMKSRDIWPKIAHVRNLRIGDKWIS
ncbi:P-loop containing nucleoside triphosphate hydrolase [Sesbania bispinosa]|nr:P-loop containing nucleoside triphosphate hydrolase [Sesbania bispinosa]